MPDELEARVITAIRSDPRSALIALDFDGTLAPIVERPGDARPVDGAVEVLERLAATVGQLALISGRASEEVVEVAGVGHIPGLLVLGHYGLQSWRAGELTTPDPVPGVDVVRRQLPAVIDGAAPGVYVEDKVHSLTVQTRPASDPQQALDDLDAALRQVAADAGLEAVPGRYVLELRPPGIDKGTALRSLIDEVGPSVVVYAGDDFADIAAIRAVKELRAAHTVDGLTIAVVPSDGSDSPEQLKDEADLVVQGQPAIVTWLAALLSS